MQTEPLKVGDTMEVNGRRARVTAINEETGQPTFQFIDKAEVLKKAEAAWNSLVINIIRKSKGLKPEEHVDLPSGGTGTYVRYAMNNQGQFALPKGRGRRKPHRKPRAILFGRLVNHYFGVALTGAYKKSVEDAKAAGKENPEPITQFIVRAAQEFAIEQAQKSIKRHADVDRKARQARQKLSRRINFGLVAGNANHCAHAA